MCCSVVFCVFQLIQVLSAYSADLGAMDMEDCTPLHYAAATGSANCCKFLAQRGAVRKSKNIGRPDVITMIFIFLGFQRWLCGHYSKCIWDLYYSSLFVVMIYELWNTCSRI